MTPRNLRARIAAAGTAVTGTGAAASLALALLVLVCAFVAVAVPRASLGYRTAVLQRSLHAASSSATTVVADATISGLNGSTLSAAQLTSAQHQLSDGLSREGLSLAPAPADWSGMVTGSAPFTVTGRAPDQTMAPPQLELVYRSGLGRNARLVSGALPGGNAGSSTGNATGTGTGTGTGSSPTPPRRRTISRTSHPAATTATGTPYATASCNRFGIVYRPSCGSAA